jgi:hypothetical protein
VLDPVNKQTAGYMGGRGGFINRRWGLRKHPHMELQIRASSP